MPGPLDGIRVIDLTQVVAGPVCTMLLGEQGAEIIKVEFLPDGDILRHNRSYAKGEMNALALNCNRGKKCIAVDLTTPEGVQIVKDLAVDADIVVHNLRAGAVERLGIHADELRAANPKLITVWMSGYGQDGPMANLPVFDPVMQAVTGHVAAQLNPNIPFHDVHRTILIDKSTALTTAQAITAALFHRERTGEGQHLEVNMLDAGTYFFWPDGGQAHTLLDDEGVQPGTTLYQGMKVTPCADGQIVYYVANVRNFNGLFRAIGRDEWVDDPRFVTPAGRAVPENGQELVAGIEAAFLSLPWKEALAKLQEQDVPASPVLQIDELHEHPQAIHNELWHEWDHPKAGRLRQPRAAAQFSQSPSEPRWWVSDLGEDTDEILAMIGRDSSDIAALRSSGTIL